MKPITEALYVGTKLITLRQDIWHNDGTAAINHTSYFCPTCGEVWGRRVYAADGIKHRVYERPCEAHGDGSLVFSELEWSHVLEDTSGWTDAHWRWYDAHYPLAWLAYELFLIVRRST